MNRPILVFLIGGLLLATNANVDAHKAVTSKYTYTEDVFPILRDRCGACHVSGGPAPMSLLAYKDASGGAFAWAESIRQMLVAQAMPPWYADPGGPPVRNNHVLSARELDVLVTWASGGTPLGDPNKTLPASHAAHPRWALGTPDIEIPLPPHTLDPDTMQDEVEWSLPTKTTVETWVTAADLRPGSPSLVRRAEITVDGGPVLAVWEPADERLSAPAGTAFPLPAGAKIHVRVSYKKPWQEEGQAKSDRSSIGLYVASNAPAPAPIESVTIAGLPGALSHGGRIIAIRPSVDKAYRLVDITAMLPSGRRLPVLRLRGVRAEWPRRYWLSTPIELPAQTIIEVKTIAGDPDAEPPGPPGTPQPFSVGLDLVPA